MVFFQKKDGTSQRGGRAMTNNGEEIIEELNIETLFKEDKYIIPIYQRNYDWGETEITQLIQDVRDVMGKKDTNYYLGTLVVMKRQEEGFEVIDGQQRLTTLGILLSVMKKNGEKNQTISLPRKLNIEFKSREQSNEIFKKDLGNWGNWGSSKKNGEDSKPNAMAIERAYEIIERVLNQLNDNLESFCKYLLNNVKILRVPLPEGTDLNHYFEIMNTRGEQLEQHEILKARCLEKIKGEKKIEGAFSLIWDACANMEGYIQYGFTSKCREDIFGAEWDSFKRKDIWDKPKGIWDKLKDISDLGVSSGSDNNSTEKKMADIIQEKNAKPEKKGNGASSEPDVSERFTPVIDFPNFLLHVLKIQEGKKSEDIALDDKQLLKVFDERLKKENGDKFVKEFGYNLLKCRYLFDKYIIKRDKQTDENDFGLKKAERYENKGQVSINYVNSFDNNEENKQIIMLLAMFHVSTPTNSYKYWLNGALKYLFNEAEEINADKYIKCLETLAKKYLYYRFVVNDTSKKDDPEGEQADLKKDYFDIIYDANADGFNKNINMDQLDRGTGVENFVFNYLDYLLWKKYRNENKNKYKNFKFTFRSSVEHFYPQNPGDETKALPGDDLDNFGNLCLISASRNSELSNFMPDEKAGIIKSKEKQKDVTESIKQMEMIEHAEGWGKKEIEKHGKEMKELLTENN